MISAYVRYTVSNQDNFCELNDSSGSEKVLSLSICLPNLSSIEGQF